MFRIKLVYLIPIPFGFLSDFDAGPILVLALFILMFSSLLKVSYKIVDKDLNIFFEFLHLLILLQLLFPGLDCPHLDDAGAIIGISFLLFPHPTVCGVGRGVTPVAGVLTTPVYENIF